MDFTKYMEEQQVIGTFEVRKIRFANEDGSFVVAMCAPDSSQYPDALIPQWIRKRDEIALAGALGLGHQRGTLLDIIGVTAKSKYGPQIKVSMVTETIRQDHRALFQFLRKLKHIGEVRANAILTHFGDAAVIMDVLERDPGQLTVIDGITDDRIPDIVTTFQNARQQWNAMKFLCRLELEAWQVQRIIEAFPIKTVETITHNPYCLIDVRGFGFEFVDNIALNEFQLTNDDPRRLVAGAKHVLEAVLNEGHTYSTRLDYAEPTRYVSKALAETGLNPDQIWEGFEIGRRVDTGTGVPAFVIDDGRVYRSEVFTAERNIAERLRGLR